MKHEKLNSQYSCHAFGSINYSGIEKPENKVYIFLFSPIFIPQQQRFENVGDMGTHKKACYFFFMQRVCDAGISQLLRSPMACCVVWLRHTEI